jgi:hypothetical protein
MAATYDTALATGKDQVRHTVGDVDVPANAQLTDEEIAYELAQAGGVVRTAALACCRRLQARYAVLTDTTEGDVSKKYSQLFDHFGGLAEALADTSAAGGGGAAAPPYAGGTSIADVEARESDTDRVPSAFGNRLGGGDARMWGR